MRVVVYTWVYNEARFLPYFLRWYGTVADRIVVYDNQSTDGSAEIARAAGADVRPWDTDGRNDHYAMTRLRNECWREERAADWVILADVDELVYHPRLRDYLGRCRRAGVTLVRPSGFDMVADRPPIGPHHAFQEITRGVPSPLYSKPCVLDPGAIERGGIDHGGHHAEPTGRVVRLDSAVAKLLHFHQMGPDHLIDRYRAMRPRNLDRLEARFPTYETPEAHIRAIHRDHARAASEVVQHPIAAEGPTQDRDSPDAGRPRLAAITGGRFALAATDGATYRLLRHGGIDLTARVRAPAPGVAFFDRMHLRAHGTRIVVTTEGVEVDGASPADAHRTPGGPTWVRDHFGQPDRLVAFGLAGWLLSIFRDPGTGGCHRGGPLEGVEHLAAFGDPPTFALGADGLLIDGDASTDPEEYRADA